MCQPPRTLGSRRRPLFLRCVVVAALLGCDVVDPVATSPTTLRHEAERSLLDGAAELALSAGASIAQTSDVWTLAKTGGLAGTTVTWTITATNVGHLESPCHRHQCAAALLGVEHLWRSATRAASRRRRTNAS